MCLLHASPWNLHHSTSLWTCSCSSRPPAPRAASPPGSARSGRLRSDAAAHWDTRGSAPAPRGGRQRQHHVSGRGAVGPGRAPPPVSDATAAAPAERIPSRPCQVPLPGCDVTEERWGLCGRAARWGDGDGCGNRAAAGTGERQGQANPGPPARPEPAWMVEGGGCIPEYPFPSRSRRRSWRRRCPAAASPAWSSARSRRHPPLPSRPFRKRKAGNSTLPVPPGVLAGPSAATASAQVPQRDPPLPSRPQCPPSTLAPEGCCHPWMQHLCVRLVLSPDEHPALQM